MNRHIHHRLAPDQQSMVTDHKTFRHTFGNGLLTLTECLFWEIIVVYCTTQTAQIHSPVK
jgi:hypothetical protein